MYQQTNLEKQDPEVWAAIDAENKRQEDYIELIASENYTSPAVMLAQGSQLTNKYAEGYPGKRYYGGCENVDVVERIAQERARKLFCEPAGVEMAVNVQPHSGAQANMAVEFAILQPGDCFMGMSLDAGGHLSHGMHLNFSGKYFKCVPYGLNEQEDIDYEEIERLAVENKPKLIIAGASAFSLRIDFKRFAEIAHKVGALIFCKPELEKKINSAVFPGIQGGPLMHVIAAKAVAFGEALKPEYKAWGEQVVKNAVAMADQLKKNGLRIVSGRTESHVMLVDLRAKKITGKAAQALLEAGHMTANKNAIPHDPEKPFVTSGIRRGTAAMTTRG